MDGARLHRAFLCVAASLFVPARAGADDGSGALEALLDQPVVESASKVAEEAGDAPATTTIVSASDLRRYGIRSLNEAINLLARGMVTQDPLHAVEIGSRGVLLTADYGDHVLLLLDGHVLNEPWNGTAYFEQGAGVPLEIVDHFEIVVGPGSVLYGSNAMLGVINIVTRTADQYRGAHLVAEGSVSPPRDRNDHVASWAPANLGGAWRVGAGGAGTLRLLGRDAQLLGHAELYTQNGPSFTWGPQTASTDPLPSFGPRAPASGVWGGVTRDSYAARVPSAYLRVTVGELSLALRAAAYRRSTPYLNYFNQSVGDFDQPGDGELDRWLSFDARYARRSSRMLLISARAYGDLYDYAQRLTISEPTWCLAPVGARGCRQDVLGASRWLGLELQTTWTWRDSSTTLWGVDARVEHIATRTDTTDTTTGELLSPVGSASGTEPRLALYLQERLRPARWVALNAGVRYDVSRLLGSRFSPRVAVVIGANSAASLKLIYAEAFRAPSYYELYYEDTWQQRAHGLRPEAVRSFEIAVEAKPGRHRLAVSGFHSWWRDMIAVQVVDGELSQLRNVSSFANTGVEGAVEGAWRCLRYGASATYAGVHSADGNLLPVAPGLFGNARVSCQLPGGLPTAALAVFAVARRPADRAVDGGFQPTPYAPAQVQLRGTLSGQVPGAKGLSFRLMLDWVSPGRGPYVAGPNQHAVEGQALSAELAPVNRLTAMLSLRLDIAP